MQTPSEYAPVSSNVVPTAVRSEEDQDFLERSTKKTKTLPAEPRGFAGESLMDGDEVLDRRYHYEPE